LPHVVAGLVTPESIVNPDTMFSGNNINLIIDRAERIDTRGKKVHLSDGREVSYDKIILSTGASPLVPNIEGHDHAGVFTLRSLSDGERIKKHLDDAKPRKLIFIGSGFISLEVASLLAATNRNTYEITVIELLKSPLPLMIDSDLGSEVSNYFEEKGIKMLLGRRVDKVLGQNGAVSGVELDGGDRIDADMVFMNVGARPNIELANEIGLDTGKYGIKVNKYLETSSPAILAGGDCVEKHHFITGRPYLSMLRGPAVIQGRLAAKRLAGFEIEFPGILNNSACKLFDKSIASTGLTEEQARMEGFDTVSATVASRSKHGMIPEFKPWTLKLVFDSKTRKLIGGQIISDAEAPVKEIDNITALILGGKDISDLTTLMCAGNPDLSSEPSLEPIAIAGEQALQKLRK
jgi:NADPH-dependent 2,4-dienoyl-CoA reductase/sulfur reductase-like enzyme